MSMILQCMHPVDMNGVKTRVWRLIVHLEGALWNYQITTTMTTPSRVYYVHVTCPSLYNNSDGAFMQGLFSFSVVGP